MKLLLISNHTCISIIESIAGKSYLDAREDPPPPIFIIWLILGLGLRNKYSLTGSKSYGKR